MKTTFFKRLLVSGLLVGLPLLGFSQAVCKVHGAQYPSGLKIFWTTCNNPESNTWWLGI